MCCNKRPTKFVCLKTHSKTTSLSFYSKLNFINSSLKLNEATPGAYKNKVFENSLTSSTYSSWIKHKKSLSFRKNATKHFSTVYLSLNVHKRKYREINRETSNKRHATGSLGRRPTAQRLHGSVKFKRVRVLVLFRNASRSERSSARHLWQFLSRSS